jgi:RNA polymerase sigma-70 factor (ECF subfamily)
MADGDTSALSAFYDLHAPTLLGLAYRILNDPKEAEDVLQEVLLQIWEKSAAYDPAQGRPLAWVLTLTRHKAIDRLRATERRRARIVEATETLPDCPSPGPSAPETARVNEQGDLLRRALANLPAAQRRAIELAFFDGLSQTEVASELNEPLGTVKARIRRGMLKLREALEQTL